jgi:ribosomal protein L32
MAVPKRKTSPSRNGMRNSHSAMSSLNMASKAPSGELGISHVAIKTSEGLFYKGKLVIKKKEKKNKQENN